MMRILLALFLSAATLSANDLVARPYVAVPLKNMKVKVSAKKKTVRLKKTFGLRGVNGPVARFDTIKGSIDVGLARDVAPATVRNFLSYVKKKSYDGSFIHRSVPGFIIQGGGYRMADEGVEEIAANEPVVNEFNISNKRGTIAMAKLGNDPDSATNQWFFNESDDNAANLDAQNGGFTVFGNIIDEAGLKVMDAIGALEWVNAGAPFDNLPVVDYEIGSTITADNVVEVKSVGVIPLLPTASSSTSVLKVSVAGNSKPKIVRAKVSKNRLILNFRGVKGKSIIRIKARSKSGGVTYAKFAVRVR